VLLLYAMLLLSLGRKITIPYMSSREVRTYLFLHQQLINGIASYMTGACIVFGALDLPFSTQRYPQRISAFSSDVCFHVVKFFVSFVNILLVHKNIDTLRKEVIEVERSIWIPTRILPRLTLLRYV